MEARTVPLFWRIFTVNAGLLALIALLLVVTPVTIHAPPTLTEVLVIVAGLAITVAANSSAWPNGWTRSTCCGPGSA